MAPKLKDKTGGPIPFVSSLHVTPKEYTLNNFRNMVGLPFFSIQYEFFTPAWNLTVMQDPLNPGINPFRHALKEKPTTEIIDKKWIYVFEKNKIVAEAYAEVDQNSKKQKIKEVSWKDSDRVKWKTTYPRTFSGKEKHVFLLDVNSEKYIFLSQVQLPFSRVCAYEKDYPALLTRSCRVDPKKPITGQEPLDLVLVDYMKIDEELADFYNKYALEFDTYLDEQENKAKDENVASRTQFAQMVQDLADKHYEVKEHIHYDELVEYNEKPEHDHDNKESKLDILCKESRLWHDTPGYKQARIDIVELKTKKSATELVKHEASWAQNMTRSESGLEYLMEEMNEPESWYTWLMEGRWEAFREIADFTTEAIDHFVEVRTKLLEARVNSLISKEKKLKAKTAKYSWEGGPEAFKKRKALLDELEAMKGKTGKAQIRQRKKLVMQEIQRLLGKYPLPADIAGKIDFINENSSQIIYKCSLKPSGAQATLTKKAIKSIQVEALQKMAEERTGDAAQLRQKVDFAKAEAKEVEKKIESLEKSVIPVSVGRLVIFVEQVNFLLVAVEFKESWGAGDPEKTTVKAAETLAAMIDAAEAFKSVLKTAANEKMIIVKGAAATIGHVIASRVDIVANAIYIGIGIYDIAKCISEKKYRQIYGEALMCVGYAISAAAAAGTVLGLLSGHALAEIAFLGISTGGWGLIAAAIIAAGAIIAYLLREQPLKEWAQQCPWGTDKPVNVEGYSKILKPDIDKQIRLLFNVLASIEIIPQINMENSPGMWEENGKVVTRDVSKFDSFQLKIVPGIFNKSSSRLLLSLHIKCERDFPMRDFTVLEEKELVIDKNDGVPNPEDPTLISYLKHVWTIDQLEEKATGRYETDDFDHLVLEFQKTSFKSLDENGFLYLRKFTITFKARLDYEGKFFHKDLDTKKEDSDAWFFPLNGPKKKDGQVIKVVPQEPEVKKRRPNE